LVLLLGDSIIAPAPPSFISFLSTAVFFVSTFPSFLPCMLRGSRILFSFCLFPFPP
jgi:hypothetical protein